MHPHQFVGEHVTNSPTDSPTDGVHINITYPVKHPTQLQVSSNIKAHQVPDVLEEYLRRTFHNIRDDKHTPADRDVYELRLELVKDKFTLLSNCGNYNLARGIVADVMSKLLTGDCDV